LTASAAYGQFTEPVSIGKSRFGAEVPRRVWPYAEELFHAGTRD